LIKPVAPVILSRLQFLHGKLDEFAQRYCPILQQIEESSGITSKPAIEGHFKTGQRTITLDELVLPYRTAVWQLQFDPIRSLPSDHQPGILQDLIPVFPFLCRELSFEN